MEKMILGPPEWLDNPDAAKGSYAGLSDGWRPEHCLDMGCL